MFSSPPLALRSSHSLKILTLRLAALWAVVSQGTGGDEVLWNTGGICMSHPPSICTLLPTPTPLEAPQRLAQASQRLAKAQPFQGLVHASHGLAQASRRLAQASQRLVQASQSLAQALQKLLSCLSGTIRRDTQIPNCILQDFFPCDSLWGRCPACMTATNRKYQRRARAPMTISCLWAAGSYKVQTISRQTKIVI